MTGAQQVGEPNQKCWSGDVLERRSIGEFLYRLVLKKHGAQGSAIKDGALCFALDGDWGTGKTFFVDQWSQDVSRYEHPVIRFDAWANDLSEDPLVGFMAQVRGSLSPWVAKLPVTRRVKAAANRQLSKVVSNARKAVLPVGMVVLKGVAKKLSGVDLSDLTSAASGDQADSESPDVGSEAGDGAKSAKDGMTEAALDKFFETAMKSHSERQDAIRSLKRTIEELLVYLESNTGTVLPLFVFIDELDRCRPDYAIRLLEGLKHLFDAKGVCFVVSTNLRQLSESVRSVYGSGFDGYRYLKRFFAFEYVLPVPDHLRYANALVTQSFLSDGALAIHSGLPTEAAEANKSLATSFAVIADAFDMDLRSQQQVFRHAEAAASGLKDGATLHCFYMFFLAAVLHYSRPSFEHFAELQKKKLDEDRKFYDDAHFFDGAILHQRRDKSRGGFVTSQVLVSDVFLAYQGLATRKVLEIWETEQKRENDAVYPGTLGSVIASSLNRRLWPGPNDLPSIADYFQLVRSAGQIR